MESICEVDCKKCEIGKNCGCKGCEETNGSPFGKKCFIAQYIKIGGQKIMNY